MRLLGFYVCLKASRDRKKSTIKLFQLGYIKKLFDCHGMLKAKTPEVPMQVIALISSDMPLLDVEKAKYSTKVQSYVRHD